MKLTIIINKKINSMDANRYNNTHKIGIYYLPSNAVAAAMF